MPQDKRMKAQMAALQSMNMLRGVQNFYKLKLGFKPQQYQVEQPSGFNNDTTPAYLENSKRQGS